MQFATVLWKFENYSRRPTTSKLEFVACEFCPLRWPDVFDEGSALYLLLPLRPCCFAIARCRFIVSHDCTSTRLAFSICLAAVRSLRLLRRCSGTSNGMSLHVLNFPIAVFATPQNLLSMRNRRRLSHSCKTCPVLTALWRFLTSALHFPTAMFICTSKSLTECLRCSTAYETICSQCALNVESRRRLWRPLQISPSLFISPIQKGVFLDAIISLIHVARSVAQPAAPSHAHRVLQHPAPSTASASVVPCANCSGALRKPAVERCEQCNGNLCTFCWTSLHSNPLLSLHKPVPLVPLGASGVTLTGPKPTSSLPPTFNPDLYDLDYALAASASLLTICSKSGFVNPKNQCWAIATLLSYCLKQDVRQLFKLCRYDKSCWFQAIT
jgi:hypothetical protein